MKSFKLTVRERIRFIISGEVFPRISTLLFRTKETLRISWDKLYAKIYVSTTLTIKSTFKVIKGILRAITKFNTVNKLSFIYTIKSIEKVESNITIKSVFSTYPVMRAKLNTFSTSQTLRLYADALVGIFPILGEYDPQDFAALDDRILADMDFKEIV